MENWKEDNGRDKLDTFLLDMTTGQSTQIDLPGDYQGGQTVTPNRKHMAYIRFIHDAGGKITKTELVIIDASGKRLRVISWEDNWGGLSGWLDDRHLGIILWSSDPETNILRKPSPLLVLNPFSGEWYILYPGYPKFLYTLSTVLPDWEGWFGVLYDPTITLAIYPRFIGNDEQMYTYALWNVKKQKLVTSLEKVFVNYSQENRFPMPRWSQDGSQFVFVGFSVPTDPSDKNPITFELYRVSWEGQAEQLTHLSEIAYLWEYNYSQSPDGRYVAMYLSYYPFGAAFKKKHLAVLDTVTQDVTDTCLSFSAGGEEVWDDTVTGLPPAPVWSPDGKQFLVVDWYAEDHRRVILVDIERGIAAQVAKDMQPLGWMTTVP
jgi:hypothetical protein